MFQSEKQGESSQMVYNHNSLNFDFRYRFYLDCSRKIYCHNKVLIQKDYTTTSKNLLCT